MAQVMGNSVKKMILANRFRQLLPVVIDVETTGLNPGTDGLLELAAVVIGMNEQGKIYKQATYFYHIEPFVGANIDPSALEITGIDPTYPLRFAIPERQALHNLATKIRLHLAESGCQRGVLVGHNSWFDLNFLQNAVQRSKLKNFPFHRFTSFDTATLAGIALGETVLARAARKARISFNVDAAHSAVYDADKTADLFCHIVNQWGQGR